MPKWKIVLFSISLTAGLVGLVVALNIFTDALIVMIQSTMGVTPLSLLSFPGNAIAGAMVTAVLMQTCNWGETCPFCNMQGWCDNVCPSCP